jgi:23S rRNA (uracil1939-C5)-methyltransferase
MEAVRRMEALMARRARGHPSSHASAPTVERLRIDSIAAGGEGVGRLVDGRAIFVHRTAPGDEVDVAVTTSRPRWARGRLLRLVVPSPQRREPPCPHYLECGGCTLEHIRYDAQLEAKRLIVKNALERIGGIRIDIPEVVPSPLQIRYRNRVSFALRRSGVTKVEAGFHAIHDPSRIVPIDGRCLLPEPPIAAVWDRLRAEWGPGAARLPAGSALRLTLRTSASGAVSLLIEGGSGSGYPEELIARVPELNSIWHRPDQHRVVHLAGDPGLLETWGGESFTVGGTAFLQVNREAADLLEQHVADLAGDLSGQRVVDAYCGIGTHSRRMAARGAIVTGIELDSEAASTAGRLAPSGVEVLTGRVEDFLASSLPADLLVLNPPRPGVAREALDTILAREPGRIIYISCDPATLARDLRLLHESYDLVSIRCFDMFPQTAHVESVVELRPRLSPARQ